MIIKGASRSGPDVLGPYLANAETNERVEVLEIRGTIAQDLVGALIEMDALAEGTNCEKPLYHAMISPEPPYRLTPEQRAQAIDTLERKLGFEGHACVVVLHEKLGREHIHIVWTRIDLDHMRAVPDSHNFPKHEEVARELEREFGHPRVQGAHAERDGVERPERSPSRAELRQEDRTGIRAKDVREEVTAAFRASSDATAFVAALEDKGYALARGDRRDFVVVDRAGGVHSLARRIEGVKAAELREFMKPIHQEALPRVETARDAQLDRQQGRLSLLDAMNWDNTLAMNAIEKDVKAESKQKLENRAKREARSQARKNTKIERGYAGAADFESQTLAANKDIKRRNKLRGPQAAHPDHHELKDERTFRKGKVVTSRKANETKGNEDRAIGSIRPKTKRPADRAWDGHPDLADRPEQIPKVKPRDTSWDVHPDIRDSKRGAKTSRANTKDYSERRYLNNERVLYEPGYDGSQANSAHSGRSLYERMKSIGASLPPQEKPSGKRSMYERMSGMRGVPEITDGVARRIEEARSRDTGDEAERLVDRQNEALGGGRSRSQ